MSLLEQLFSKRAYLALAAPDSIPNLWSENDRCRKMHECCKKAPRLRGAESRTQKGVKRPVDGPMRDNSGPAIF